MLAVLKYEEPIYHYDKNQNKYVPYLHPINKLKKIKLIVKLFITRVKYNFKI